MKNLIYFLIIGFVSQISLTAVEARQPNLIFIKQADGSVKAKAPERVVFNGKLMNKVVVFMPKTPQSPSGQIAAVPTVQAAWCTYTCQIEGSTILTVCANKISNKDCTTADIQSCKDDWDGTCVNDLP
ncbi:MAG: hypothetical protein R3257_02630 [bacterium]|nr:hypothetical protein [bacterium]